MEGLTIVPPKGYEVDKEKSIPFERIEFKEIHNKRTDRTWKEILGSKRGTMYYLTSMGSTNDVTMGSDSVIDSCTNHVNTVKQADKVCALCQLFIIMDHYNDGWIPNWDNCEEGKFKVVFNMSTEKMEIDCNVTASLSSIYFKSRELADEAYQNNKEIFDLFYKP